MFQDTLLIIKPDFMYKRKGLLLCLTQQGFFIKAERKVCFTPELAAEFYQDRAEDVNFMFQVILLTKGISEAFILSKNHAVKELVDALVCYIGSSTEMEEKVHVTNCQNKVQRQIAFIFPNHIQEPILLPDHTKFCVNNAIIKTTVNTLYDVVSSSDTVVHKHWKKNLSEALILTDKTLPQVYNQCSNSLQINVQSIAQQTEISCTGLVDKCGNIEAKSVSSDLSQVCSSLNISSSSCISCSGFDSGSICPPQDHLLLEDIIKARTAPLKIAKETSSSDRHIEQGRLLQEENVQEQVEADKLIDVVGQEEETYRQMDILLETDINAGEIQKSKEDIAKSGEPDTQQSKEEAQNEEPETQQSKEEAQNEEPDTQQSKEEAQNEEPDTHKAKEEEEAKNKEPDKETEPIEASPPPEGEGQEEK